MSQARVIISERATEIVRLLKAQHGPLIFHQSGGCCDGSAPMCLTRNDFRLGSQDLYLGEIEGCPYTIAKDTYSYYERCQILIDVVEGRGASFSLEIPLGVRFMTVSTVLSEAEASALFQPLPADEI